MKHIIIEKFKDISYRINELKRGIFNMMNNDTVIKLRRLKRTSYYDPSTLMFEAMFEVLRHYVEKECAWMQALSNGNYTLGKSIWRKKMKFRIPGYVSQKTRRELGLKYLDWEISLGDEVPHQSETALTVKRLYLWYMDEYPNWKEPYDFEEPEFPYIDIHGNPTKQQARIKVSNSTNYIEINSVSPEYAELLENAHLEEEKQRLEVDNMMIELAKVSRHLWT